MYQVKLRTISELKETIRRIIATIPVAMLTNVMRNFNDRLQEFINVDGLHLSGIIFHITNKATIFSYNLFFLFQNLKI